MITLTGILKKSKVFLLVNLLALQIAFACDFSKGVTENPDGTFKYTRECHIEAGKKIKGYGILEEKNFELEKQVSLKDMIITKHEERTAMWMDTSLKLNDKLQTYDRLATSDRWTSFAIGFGAALLSIYVSDQALRSR